MRHVAKRGVAKRELFGRNGVKFVYLMPPTECWTGSQQIQIWLMEVTIETGTKIVSALRSLSPLLIM